MGSTLKVVMTKLSDSDYEKFKKLCENKGKSVYQCLKDLVLSYLIESGENVNDPPLDVKVEVLEREIARLKNELNELRKLIEKKPSGLTRFGR